MMCLILLLGVAACATNVLLSARHDPQQAFGIYGPASSDDNVSPEEIAALFDLYNATGGTDWEWGNDPLTLPGIPWNFSDNANPCLDGWQGINCTITDTLHISEISLSNVGMLGVLPESLASLSELAQLLLMNNVLWGPIPEQLGNLSQLKVLNLNENLLEGTIPNSFEWLHKLIVLNLSQNRLSGPIPSLRNATDLLELDIASNFFTGCVFDSIEGLPHLEWLLMNNNLFSGSIPESFGNQRHLRRFLANINLLNGTLPDSIGQLSELRQLNLATNLIEGTLPAAVGNWTKVRDVYFQTNMISGKIPDSVGNLRQLQILSLQTNKLVGTIPASLCNITTLKALRLYVNGLTGPVPACLALNYNFTVFVVYENQLTGPLPSAWAAHSRMNYFDVNDNHMTGTIPEAFGGLSQLGSLYLGSNTFHGSVPASLSALTSLVWLYLSYNYLTGSIPSDIGNLDQLLYIEMSGNRMSGTLPASIGDMSQLEEIHFDTNAFQGLLPASWAQLTQLLVLNVYRNHLTGPVPSQLGLQTSKLQFIGLDSNRLTGTLPATLGDCTYLQSLQVQDNLLRGTLPGTLKGLEYLTTLLVQSNRFSGRLDGVFGGATQRALSTIQLSNNKFTGTLPAEVFYSPKLITFAAVSNCFEGSLPATLCDNSALEVLALSGLQAASGCQQRLLPVLSNAYVIKNPLTGGIPDCMYKMASLKTLQLAGNGLTGSLPDDVVISSALQDLTLSHNSLTGHIPGQFQERQWETLDLSYNRFGGTLQPSLSTQNCSNYTIDYSSAALSLEGNRLSGNIPRSVDPIRNISILAGNLFTCNVLQTNLPPHDSAISNYECGSTTFEVPFYVWLGCFGALLLAAVWTVQRVFPLSAPNTFVEAVGHLRKWYAVLEAHEGVSAVQSELDNLRYVLDLYHHISRLAVLVALFCVFVLLPLYAFMSAYYGTLTHQYAYRASAAFHSGAVPLGLEMAALLVLLVLVIVCFAVSWHRVTARTAEQQKKRVESGASSTAALPVYSSLLNRLTVYAALLLTNTAVVVACNVAYVYIALYESSALLLFAQIVLSFYKLSWNKFCASSLIPWTARVLSTSVSNDLMISSVEFFPLQLFLALFNNIVIPCLVVAVVSPNCFSYLLTSAPSVDSQYVVNQCLNFDDVNNVCKTFFAQTESTSFNPPFTYSYQCSASFVTYYAPAFVIMCIMSTFGIPLVQFGLVLLHKRSQSAEAAQRISFVYHAVDMLLPTLLKPPFPSEETQQEDLEERWTMVQRDIYKPQFPANQFLLSMLTYLGILLTFGAVFPPLAVALAVTVVGAAAYARVKVGRFLHVAIAEKQYKFLELINKECRGVGSMRMLQAALFLQVTVSCCFFALFLFDTLGDSAGANDAYWVLIVMPLMPAVLYVAFLVLRKLLLLRLPLLEADCGKENTEPSDVEMTKSLPAIENCTINSLHADSTL